MMSRNTISRLSLSVLPTLLAASIAITGLVGCGGKLDAENNKPVVTITEKKDATDSIIITKGEYNKLYNELLEQTPLDLSQVNSGQLSAQQNMLAEKLKEVTLNKLIYMSLIKDAAKDANVSISDEKLNTYKTKQLKKLGGMDKLTAILKAKGISEDEFNKNLKEDLLVSEFFKQQPNSNITVSETEAKQFYNTNKPLFHLPKGISVSHILVKIDPQDMKNKLIKQDPKISQDVMDEKIKKITEEKKALAEKLLADVKADESKLPELAKQHSDDTVSAVAGGHIDALYKDMTAPEFWAASEKAGKGKLVPELVKTQFGYHIIKVEDVIPAHQEPFAKVQDNIIAVLEQQRQQQAMMIWAKARRDEVTFDFAEGFTPANYTQPKADQKAEGEEGVTKEAASKAG